MEHPNPIGHLLTKGVPVRSQMHISTCVSRGLLAFSVPGRDAIDLWRIARRAVDATGYWPVIAGGRDQLDAAIEVLRYNCDNGHTPSAALQAADTTDVAAWLTQRIDEFGISDFDLDGSTSLPHPRPNDRFTIHTDVVLGHPLNDAWFVLTPSRNGWNVPAHLLFGGWNDAPFPSEHVALLRRWHEEYGAELVGMNGDTIEMAVAWPPSTEKDALALARQQYVYAPDIVWQGTGRVEALAAALLHAPVWYFWWD